MNWADSLIHAQGLWSMLNINAENYTKYNFCLNHILIIQKKQKFLLTQEKGEKTTLNPALFLL